MEAGGRLRLIPFEGECCAISHEAHREGNGGAGGSGLHIADVMGQAALVASGLVGCAVHLCVDIQGWSPPKDFADQLITRSRRRIDHRGISSYDVDISGISTIYGNSQSFLFGSADGLQFSLYRKDLQVQATDKSHFWVPICQRRTTDDFKPIYDPAKPVWRFELTTYQFLMTVQAG